MAKARAPRFQVANLRLEKLGFERLSEAPCMWCTEKHVLRRARTNHGLLDLCRFCFDKAEERFWGTHGVIKRKERARGGGPGMQGGAVESKRSRH